MLIRTDPFSDLQRLTREFAQQATPRTLAMDAYRDGDVVVVEFDAPGVDPERIEVTVERDVLTVAADRPGPQGRQMLAHERPTGRFTRQVALGESLEFDQLDANMRNGVLRITIPVSDRVKPRRVQVSGGDNPAIDVGSKPQNGGS
jgi:HSP20 family protein